jgi:PIN domain nuclease of toxin-antitoxin system
MAAAVADAHALIWYAMGPGRRLGRAARRHFARAERGQAIVYVPAVVFVEIAEAMRRERFDTTAGFRDGRAR